MALKFFLNKKDREISQTLIFDKFWEFEESEYFKKIISKGMNIVDIGSNIGYFSLLFSKWTGSNGRVYCFEPDEENYQLLLKNIRYNDANNIILQKKALSDKKGKTTLFIDEINKGDHRIIDMIAYTKDEKMGKKKVEVETTTLDSEIPLNEKIDLIKMDIQGAEMLALKGMKELIKKNLKITLLTEFWPFGIKKSGNSPKEFIDTLIQL